MAGVKVRAHIAAPPETVFAAATDLPTWAERMEGIEQVEVLTEGPMRLGTRFRETRVMFGRAETEEMEVTGFDAPRSYTIGCENHGCRYHSEMTFKPNGGGTDVELSFEATPLSAMAKLMSAMLVPLMKKMGQVCEKDLQDLKASIETR